MAFKIEIKKEVGYQKLETKKSNTSLLVSRISDSFKEYFYNQLYVLITSGVDLKSSLQLLSDEVVKSNEKQLLQSINQTLVAGQTFSDSMQRTGKFDSYEIQSIKIGEETGRLTTVLKELTFYYKNKIKQRRQIISALTYPMIILIVALAAISFLLFYMVPMFEDVFKKFNKDLPGITLFVLNISKFLKYYFIYFLMLVIGFVLLGIRSKNKIWYRKYMSMLLIKIPVLGEFIHKIYLVRFCRSMALMLNAKLSLVDAITLSKSIVGFYPMEVTMDDISNGLLKGGHLYEQLHKYSIYPQKMILMIKIAEQVNKLDVFFDQLAIQYQEEMDHQTSILSSLIEPVIILFLGVIVAFVLVAMYLPMFELGSLF